jgi:ubiquinone/menaquinone biosynthesis C-methylase UbiE
MFADPKINIKEFGLSPGQTVADFGSGVGHYSFPLSDAVGPKGAVYCIDIKKDVLVSLKNQAIKEGRENIEVIWADVDKPNGTKFRQGVVDVVLLSDLLFQLSSKDVAIKEAKRILKPEGRIIVIDWSEVSYLNGVKHEGKNIVLSEDELKTLMELNGLKLERRFEAGEHHYGLIFKS